MGKGILTLGLYVLMGVSSVARGEMTAFETKVTKIVGGKGSAKDKATRIYQAHWDYLLFEYPEMATAVGSKLYGDRWSDYSIPTLERRKRETVTLKKVFGKIKRSELKESDRLNYDLFKRDLEEGIEGQRFPGEFIVIDQMGGVHQWPPQVFNQMPHTTVADYDLMLSRLKSFPQVIEQMILLMKEGLKRGVTPPKMMLATVGDAIKGHAEADPEKATYLAAFRKVSYGIDEAQAAKIRKQAEEIYFATVLPAVQKLHSFWVNEYYPHCRETMAWSDLPDGKAWYAYQVKKSTTTDLSPGEIHEIGLKEVKRIRGEMDKVIASTKFKGTFADFLKFLRTDSQFYFEKGEELLVAYRDIAKRADPQLPKLFGKLPRLPYGVSPVPSYSEKTQTTAYYEPGSGASGRPGIFYANTYDLKARPKYEMEALSLHEAVPGHHLQLALASEMENVPEFRKWQGYTSYIEGWGLYAESLGKEMGFYADPYSHFGQLTYEVWRAIRLVVDTGMHALGWSREKAFNFFKENAGKTDHDINVEIDRYIVWAGQALAYKIGELKIKELRAYATEELGDAFDVRKFHDTVLGEGCVPLSVLEANVRNWVKASKSQSKRASR